MEIQSVTSIEPEPNRQRFPGLYVGNLTWWTTDQDVINAINSVGVTDVQEVRFFENRNNGQSKGFCVVTFGSETSLPIVMTKLPKLELYGQNPVVTQYNRHNLNLFESQTKTRPQINSNNGPNSHAAGIMGISSISGVHAGTQGLPYSDGMNSFQQQGVMGQGVMPNTPGAGGGGIRPPYHPRMGLGGMRGPRPMMRGGMSNTMGNGPYMHDMMRHPVFRQEQVVRQEPVFRQETVGRQEPMYRQDQASRQDHRSRLTWDSGSSSSRREPDSGSRWPDERPMPRDGDGPSRWPDERSSGREDKSLSSSSRRLVDERSSNRDEKSSSRRAEERVSSRDEKSSSSRRQDDRREEKSSSRRSDGRSEGRSEGRSSSRREEKSSSSSSRRERSHRSRDRSRSRSREERSRR